MNTFGRMIHLTLFGESHGPAIGCVLDGLPAGFPIDWEYVRNEMARRAPGRTSFSSSRKEGDAFEILSGVLHGRTTGTPLAAVIRNQDARSGDYRELSHVMRPGHADFTGREKYFGWNDIRGGGHFSGRLTAPLVLAGAIAEEILRKEGIGIGAHAASIHGIRDRSFSPLGGNRMSFEKLRKMALPVLDEKAGEKMIQDVLQAAGEKNSVGGTIECAAEGLPAGLGDPFFDSVESELSKMMFSIPAVKGISFGSGFDFDRLTGQEAEDPMTYSGGKVVTTANHNGGLLGGITNGMPLLFTVVIKPAASIGAPQKTVDMEKKENTVLAVQGRHDPCIVPRAVPVVEAGTAWVLLDFLMERKKELAWK